MQSPDQIGRRLKLRQLEVFSAVVECGTMGKAAEQLSISQPVVSKAIADLEYTLGVRLLDRGPKGVEPTLYGRSLLKRGITIFDELRESVKEIQFLADPNAGELRIGCTETMTAGLVSAVIDRLSRRYPRMNFHLALADVETLQSHFLRERKSELVVGRVLSADPDPDITAESLFYEQHVVVTKPPNKWLKRRKITLAELVNEPWILSPLEVQPGTPVVEAFRAIGLDHPKALIVSNSLNLRNNLLATGRFVTVVPGSVLRFVPEYLLFKVLPLKLPIATFPTAVLTLKNRMLSPMAELFIECVRELARPLAKEMKHNRPVRR